MIKKTRKENKKKTGRVHVEMGAGSNSAGFRKPKAIDITSDWGVWGLRGVYEAGSVDLKLIPPCQVREGVFRISFRSSLCFRSK